MTRRQNRKLKINQITRQHNDQVCGMVLKISLISEESDHWRLKWKASVQEMRTELNLGDRQESAKEGCKKNHR